MKDFDNDEDPQEDIEVPLKDVADNAAAIFP